MLVSNENVATSGLLNRDLSGPMEANDRFPGAIAKYADFKSLCTSFRQWCSSWLPQRERRFAELAHLPVRVHRMILSEGTLVEISDAARSRWSRYPG